ncbi:helix-turn-helix domain-containing protein [Dyadobacter endophyticus]|uniref:helix-turn-helix domain-containing protein n=1 Tax=Dyadobacter endophyticus TaxID=1749036 RepID=UPI003CEA5795
MRIRQIASGSNSEMKAKAQGTWLTVSEIGFQLGFEFPQSFSRLFKSRTNVTPLFYRRSQN